MSTGMDNQLLPGEWTFTHDGSTVRAKHVDRRFSRTHAIYTWEPVPGGMLDRFETEGIPEDMKKAPT